MTELSQSFDADRINRAAAEKTQLFLAELEKSPHHEFALRYWYAIAYTRACGKIYQDKVVGLFNLAQDNAARRLEVFRRIRQRSDEHSNVAEELKQSLANQRQGEDPALEELLKANLRLAAESFRHQGRFLDIEQAVHDTNISMLNATVSYWDSTFRYVLESSTVEEFSKSLPERLSALASAVNPVYSFLASLWAMVKPPKPILQTEAGSVALEYLDGYIDELNRYAVTAVVADAAAIGEADELALQATIDESQPEVDFLVKSYLPQELFGSQV